MFFARSAGEESTERRAARDYDLLSTINGYPDAFSIFQGEMLELRVALKPGSSIRLPRLLIRVLWRNRLTASMRHKLRAKATRSTQTSRKPAAFAVQVEIHNRGENALLRTCKLAKPVPLFAQMPETYRDNGANYAGCISLDTADWLPGVYECVVRDSRGRKSEDIYINIKPRTMENIDLLCILPTFTWQAYNRIGGGSFYSPELGARRTISVHRPMHHLSDNSIVPSLALLSIFQKAGVRVACVDSSDLHHGLCPAGEVPVAAILAHDEYWSASMRAEVDRLLDRGTSVLVIAGNTCWWRIDVEGQNISVLKDTGRTTLWHRISAPEEQTLLSSFRFGGYAMERARRKARLAPRIAHLSKAELRDSGAITVTDPSHPIFRGVRLENGLVGRKVPIVYREIDGVPLTPGGSVDKDSYKAQFTPHVIATGLTLSGKNVRRCGVVVEACVRNGYVLNMGSIGWSRGVVQKHQDTIRIVLNAYEHCRAKMRR